MNPACANKLSRRDAIVKTGPSSTILVAMVKIIMV